MQLVPELYSNTNVYQRRWGSFENMLYCPAVFGHFSPAPVKTDRVVQIQ